MMKEIIRQIEEYLSSVKTILETLGIFGGLVILYFTYQSINLANENIKIAWENVDLIKEQIELANQQLAIERTNIIPNWKFDINLQRKSFSVSCPDPNFKLNDITFYLPTDSGMVKMDYKVNGDEIEYDFIEELLYKKFIRKYNQDRTFIETTTARFPAGVELFYSYQGNSKTDGAIWQLKYRLNWKGNRDFKNVIQLSLYLSGVESYRYFNGFESEDPREEMLKELQRFASLTGG